jgi:hypothetical protein
MSPRWGFLVACALLVGALPAGCGSTSCDCTDGNVHIFQMPPSGIVSLTADSPCTAYQSPWNGGVDISVDIDARITSGSGRCDLHETLADGTMMVATLNWKYYSGCCAGIASTGPAPEFRVVSAP